MKLAILFATGAAASGLSSTWEQFKEKFGREYENAAEEMEKFRNFLKNAEKLDQMQVLDDSAEYSLLTPFADYSEADYKKLNGLRVDLWDEKEHKLKELPKLPTDNLPKNFDWRKKGAVNDVKDQAQCGSCWAFGTVANIEGAGVVQGGKDLLNLSEQELVDCSASDNGCAGGLPSRAYNDMLKNHMWLEAEKDYPYTARNGQCKADKSKEVGRIDDWKSISSDEEQIRAAVYKYGPLAIGLNANSLQMYHSGIANPWFCNPMAIDHAVTLVGWGTVDSEDATWPWDKTKDYWIVRNSWGGSWGESGYFRLARGKGKCGMNRMVTTAIFNKAEEEM